MTEYAFPTVLQFLQSEWRRFERDRNEWDIEKAEMKARIAFLEGEKRGVDNSKMDLMKRVKMLEYALRQERSKYVEQQRKDSMGQTQAQFPPGVTQSDQKAQNRMSTYSASSQNMTQVSPTSSTPGSDPIGRAKSREFLRVCLQEISYLTASVPQSIASVMPTPSRASRHHNNNNDLERKPTVASPAVAPGGRNRKSDYFPMNGPTTGHAHSQPPPPMLSRSSSVPVPTLQSLTGINKTTVSGVSGGIHGDIAGRGSNSPPLMETSLTGTADAMMEDRVEDAALRQLNSTETTGPRVSPELPPQQQEPQGQEQQQPRAGSTVNHTLHQRDYPSIDSVSAGKNPALADTKIGSAEAPPTACDDMKESSSPHSPEKRVPVALKTVAATTADDDGWNLDDEEPRTVVYSPISAEQWRTQLKKAGQQASLKNRADDNQEDEAQLSKDVQDAFNISSGRLSKMVKDWDKSKPIASNGHKSISKKRGKDSGVLDELANLTISEEWNDFGGDTKETEPALDEPARWRLKVTLRRHLDTIRSIALHPLQKSILSGSEDGTMRYWNLESPLRERHTKAITSVAISADQNKCFSSSLDSTIRSYKVVPLDKEPYSRTDPTIPIATYVGHTDAVWGIRLFPISISTSQLLASISADGSLKIWDTQLKSGSPLKSSWGFHGQNHNGSTTNNNKKTLPVPTSLDFCPTDLKKMVVSYNNSVVKLFDIETGKDITTFQSNESYDGTPATQINKIVCHPTMPLMVTGHEDRYIRYFDLNTGSCNYSSIAHLDAVAALDFDPTGLVLCSGGHDCSVRMWDIGSNSRPCVQEFTGHRRKGDEGVCVVQYHPTVPGLFATGGADSIVKVYTRC
ncbi:hypothetical protein BGZ83_005087 [Gryganskiella cystojenkinii]|nr:hypothetical protein BGZ83_005087 [Gryganskiella cystojenkinii]